MLTPKESKENIHYDRTYIATSSLDMMKADACFKAKGYSNDNDKKIRRSDAEAAMEIWNSVVREGIAFPQLEELTEDTADRFFSSQSYTGIAVEEETGQVVGLYILHPNNVGRCGHICNTSYAVREGKRGLHTGEKLVKDSLRVGAKLGFRILQFNAVVASNVHALHLYKRLGFHQLGVIPEGFLMKDGHYEDIVLHYIELK